MNKNGLWLFFLDQHLYLWFGFWFLLPSRCCPSSYFFCPFSFCDILYRLLTGICFAFNFLFLLVVFPLKRYSCCWLMSNADSREGKLHYNKPLRIYNISLKRRRNQLLSKHWTGIQAKFPVEQTNHWVNDHQENDVKRISREVFVRPSDRELRRWKKTVSIPRDTFPCISSPEERHASASLSSVYISTFETCLQNVMSFMKWHVSKMSLLKTTLSLREMKEVEQREQPQK